MGKKTARKAIPIPSTGVASRFFRRRGKDAATSHTPSTPIPRAPQPTRRVGDQDTNSDRPSRPIDLSLALSRGCRRPRSVCRMCFSLFLDDLCHTIHRYLLSFVYFVSGSFGWSSISDNRRRNVDGLDNLVLVLVCLVCRFKSRV